MVFSLRIYPRQLLLLNYGVITLPAYARLTQLRNPSVPTRDGDTTWPSNT
jgi:hypothetical protein